jgi:hypothetical protein
VASLGWGRAGHALHVLGHMLKFGPLANGLIKTPFLFQIRLNLIQTSEIHLSLYIATHLPLFTKVGETLEADHWLCVIESKFGLLHCMEHQKTLFAAQQLREDASVWWANL